MAASQAHALAQAYARVKEEFAAERRGREHHLPTCEATRDETSLSQESVGRVQVYILCVSGKRSTSTVRQRDKTVANKTPPHQKGLIKSSIYLSEALDK